MWCGKKPSHANDECGARCSVRTMATMGNRIKNQKPESRHYEVWGEPSLKLRLAWDAHRVCGFSVQDELELPRSGDQSELQLPSTWAWEWACSFFLRAETYYRSWHCVKHGVTSAPHLSAIPTQIAIGATKPAERRAVLSRNYCVWIVNTPVERWQWEWECYSESE